MKKTLFLTILFSSILISALPAAVGNDINNPGQTALEIARMAYERSNPIGAVMTLAYQNCPAGSLPSDGRLLNQTSYPELYRVLGKIYGGNSTQFRLPDLRGEFIRGFDNGRGVDGGRRFGNRQNHNTEDLFVTVNHHDKLAFSLKVKQTPEWASDRNTWTSKDGWNRSIRQNTAGLDVLKMNNSSETRPRNIALQYCIVTG